MELVTALGASILLLFLPGYVFVRILFRNPEQFSLGERWFLPVSISILLTTWLALTLAEFGAFALWNVIAIELVAVAGVLLIPRRRLGAWSLRFTRPDWVFLAIFVLAVLLFARPAEYLTGNGDAGTYVNTGASIARTGGIALYDAQVAQLPYDSAKTFYWQLINPFMLYKAVRMPGFFIADPARGLIVPQFLHFYPAWLALWDALLGVRWGLYATPLIGLLASVAFYFLVKTIGASFVGFTGRDLSAGGVRNLARLAFFLLVIAVPQFWFARYPVAEAMTQFLMLLGMYAALKFEQTRDGSLGLPLLGGFAFGAIFLTRADAVLLLVPLTLYAVVRIFGRSWRREHWAFFGAFGVVAAQAAAHMLVFAPNYLYFQYAHALRMKNVDKLLPGGLPSAETLFSDARYGLAALGLLVLGAAVLFVADRVVQRVRRRWGGAAVSIWARVEQPVRVGGAALIATLAILTYFVWAQPDSLYAYVGGLTPADRAANLVKIGWYLSPLGIALATLGAVIAVTRDLNSRNLLFFGSAGLFTAFYLDDLYSNPHYIYTMRHYIPLVIPLFILLAARALTWLWQGGGEWAARWIRSDAQRVKLGRLTAGGAFCLWMLYTLYAMGLVDGSRASGLAVRVPGVTQAVALGPLRLEPFEKSIVGVHELGGAFDQLQALAESLPPDAVVIFSGGRDEPAALAEPLEYIFGRDAFVTVFNNPPGDKVAALVHGWRAQGREVILAYGTNGGRLDIPGYALEPVGEAALDVPQWAFAYDFMPRSAWRLNLNFGLYRAVPRTAPEPYPFVLDFGGGDFPHLVNGFLERSPEASTRWIGAIPANPAQASGWKWVTGSVRVPRSPAQSALVLTLRARAPRDDVRLQIKSGEHTFGAFQLSRNWQDYALELDPAQLSPRSDSYLIELVSQLTPDSQGRVLGAELESLRLENKP